MSTHCYIGATRPDNPHLVHARWVLVNGHPAAVLPALAAIWASHAHHDSTRLITAILAHDWELLDPNIATATTRSPFAGQRPVPGVGMALASEVDLSEPVTVFPLCHAGHLDTEWIYLIEARTDTVTLHASDGTCIAPYRLVDCLPHRIDRGERARGSESAAGAAR